MTEILAAAINAVNPYTAVRDHFAVEEGQIIVDKHRIDLDDIERIFLVGAGKAGLPMAEALIGMLGKRVTDGIVIVKEGYGGVDQLGKVKIREARHPLPDERGVQATEELLEIVSGASEKDLVICVISGGGSALMTAPVDGFWLGEMSELTAALMASGAAIVEINTVRKQLDQVKGGGLAKAAFPAQVVSLILSDVVGDPLGVIASGPTVPGQETNADAIEILKRYDLLGFIPVEVFDRWQTAETADHGIEIDRVMNILVGCNTQAAEAARRKAGELGLNAAVLSTRLEGEARQVGAELAGVLRRMVEESDPLGRPGVLIAGGETTVTIRGGGRGGRNQELALAAVEGLAGLEDIALVTLATDGGDGNSMAAGAVVTGETLASAKDLSLAPAASLEWNDSDTFFKALDDQVITGPTQTNVNDLVFLFVF
ncbi:MAG: DUF4147 domain-containing protein [Chloroflexota bacterium]